MNNTIDLSKLPISPNEDIKNVVAINNDGDVIIAENYTQTDIDLSDYVTAEEINKELENYPTFTDLEDELQTYVEFPDLEDYVTDTELSTTLNDYVTDTDLSTALQNKQDTLISSENIKTINGTSILGSGDIVITGDGESVDLSNYYNKQEVNNLIADKISETDLGIALANYVTDTDLSTTLNNYVTDSELSGYNYIDESELADAVHNIEVQITPIVKVTQAEYDSMVKDENTLYIII